MIKLGIIIPWFGRELKGGAEQQAWQVATRLAARGHHVEVLTTCCRSHQDDWETNHLPEGLSMEREGFAVRRFPVERRDRAAFDRVCGNLLQLDAATLTSGVAPVSAEASHTFVSELIKTPALLEYLKEHKQEYGSFILLPYLYGPILEAVLILGAQAALQPCLHDESYAYLPEVADAFYRAKHLLFNSEGEQELALRLYGPGIWNKSVLVGEGVEIAEPLLHHPITPALPGSSRFLLYLGRKDEGKNTPLLLRAFQRFRAVRPNSDLRLVLAGNGVAHLNGAEGASDLGLVSEEKKLELLRQCTALVQPSQKESFSRVMMEAWLHGKPVAAHTRCPATAIPVKRAQAGWLADSEEEWSEFFVDLDRASDKELRQLGENGRSYAAQAADWDQVMERYEAALNLHTTGGRESPFPETFDAPAINQFLPNLTYGDAISNHALWIRDQLRSLGYKSEIYVRFVDPRVAHECHSFIPEALNASDAAIYHHSIGTEITPYLRAFNGPKCLIYHNITPAEFFEPYRPEFAKILTAGRRDLSGLADQFPLSYSESVYNVGELESVGFHKPGLLPIPVDPGKWAKAPDPALMFTLQDGRTNLLFVGRFAPNKKQDDLIVAFSNYLLLDPSARLILAGKPEESDPYVTHVRETISALGLEDSVLCPGSITDAQLAAYYRTAHLFWSMSEHEGFCVPLIEAMWFDVPVLAYRSSAVPETLGPAALMLNEKTDLAAVAALARVLVVDSALRDTMISAQRKRRVDFLPDKIAPLLNDIARQLCPAASLRKRHR
jgi:glycosyltransferase involved in cell wall biosynthesis